MTYSALAWKNLVRRPVRTALTAGGVALAVAVAVSLGGFNLGSILGKLGGTGGLNLGGLLGRLGG